MSHDGNPLVSVITATYNRDKYVLFAIESVLNQTYKNIEYHLVDDGSTDNTMQIAEKYLNDSRFHYYFQENKGQNFARNVGLKNAKGEYIAFLDSDNLWYLDKIEKQVNLLLKYPDVDIIYGEMEDIDESGNVIKINQPIHYSGYITEKLLRENFVGFNSAIFKSNCYKELGGLSEEIRRGDDYELWLRYSTRFYFLYVSVYFGKYRIMKNQISTNKEARFESNHKIINDFIVKNSGILTEKIREETLIHYYTVRGRYRASSRNYRDALKDYFKAMTYNPIHHEPWRALTRMLLLWK